MRTFRPTRAIWQVWTVALLVACGLLLLSACAASGTNSPSDLIWRVAPYRFQVESLSWSPNGKLLASAGHLGTVKVFDIASKQMVAEKDYFPGFTHQLAWSPDSSFLALAIARPGGKLQLWHYPSGQTTNLPNPEPYDEITSLSWSPSGVELAVGIANLAPSGAKLGGSIDIYNTQTLTYTQVVTVPEPIDSVAWSPNGNYLAAGYSAGLPNVPNPNVQIWDASTFQSLAAYNHAFSVLMVAWSPDSDILASGDSGAEASSVKLWSVSENRFIADLAGHSSLINTLAWSPRGDYLASGSWDTTVRLWETSSWKHMKTFEAPHYVNTVAFSPDGNLIAVGCANGEIIFWSIPQE